MSWCFIKLSSNPWRLPLLPLCERITTVPLCICAVLIKSIAVFYIWYFRFTMFDPYTFALMLDTHCRAAPEAELYRQTADKVTGLHAFLFFIFIYTVFCEYILFVLINYYSIQQPVRKSRNICMAFVKRYWDFEFFLFWVYGLYHKLYLWPIK